MKLLFLTAITFLVSEVCLSGAPSPSPEPIRPEDGVVLNQQAKDFISKNFQAVKSKSLKVYVDEAGNIITGGKTKEIKTVVDYIQLLASDLVAAQSTNKMMLLEGFILMAIIQGDMWPVDYVNPAVKVGADGTVNEDTKNLLMNAAKIAAYAMTYRMGVVDQSDGAIQRARALGTFQTNKNDYNYLFNGKANSSFDRSQARKLLNQNQTPQAQALEESRNILKTFSDKRPRDSKDDKKVEMIYQTIYGDNSQKATHGGAPKGLPELLNGQSVNNAKVDECLGIMQLINEQRSSTSASSNRVLTNRRMSLSQ